jgi:predicted porin
MDTNSAVGDTKNATKVMYLTPRVGGFQFGVSYTPSTNHVGEARMNTAFSQTRKPFQVFDINSRVLGVNYLHEFRDGLIMNLSAAHLSGNTRSERADRFLLLRNSTNSWDCGAVFALGRWSLGTEYIWNGRSGRLKNNISAIAPSIRQTGLGGVYSFPVKSYEALSAGKYYSVNSGIAYTEGDVGVSFSYFYTRKNTGIVSSFGSPSSRSVGRAWAISTEYNLAPGFCPYLEGAVYRMSNPDWPYLPVAVSNLTGLEVTAVPSNKARMVLAGIKVQF